MQDMAANPSLPAMPFERPSPLELPPQFLRLQAERPVTRVRTPTGDLAWLVTGYERVRDLFGDDRLGRSHPDPANAARYSWSPFGGPMFDFATEHETHGRLRRVLTRSFMVKRMNGLRPAIQALVDDLLDQLAAGTPPADLHQALSVPLPVLVICELLGVPYEDRADFRRWSDDATCMTDAERATSGFQGLITYMGGHVARRREQRGEDVVSDLVNASEVEDDAMTDAEVVELAAGVLFAGHETTMTMLDTGALLLLTHPEQRRHVEQDPAAVDAAVEEIMRVGLLGDGIAFRYARTEVEVDGTAIPAGDLVLLGVGAANRDEGAFPDAERFDVQRTQNHHVGFGHGNRFCLGAGLARNELRTALGTLLRRFPTLELAVPVEELRVRDQFLTGGLEALPVTW